MEGIYRSSRLVVIALDDIEVGHDECNFLEEYGEEFAEAQGKAELEARMRGDEPDGGVLTNLNEYAHPQYLLSNRAFGSLYHKIIDSNWNNRAWYSHEARLSQDIVVLMRCAGQSAKVLRLSPKFLSHMMHLGLQLDDANNNKTSTLLESSLPSAMRLTALEAWSRLSCLAAGGSPNLEGLLRLQSADQDKIAISLNVAGTGISIAAQAYEEGLKSLLSPGVLYRRLVALALASNDVGTLCTQGQFLLHPENRGTSSWVSMPDLYHVNAFTTFDSTAVWTRTEAEIEKDSRPFSFSPHDLDDHIELSMMLPANTWTLNTREERYERLASAFINVFLVRNSGLLESRMSALLRNFVHSLAWFPKVIVQWMGSMLKCGTPWMIGSWKDFENECGGTGDPFEAMRPYRSATPFCLQVPTIGPQLEAEALEARIRCWLTENHWNQLLSKMILTLGLTTLLAAFPGRLWHDIRKCQSYVATTEAGESFLLMMSPSQASHVLAVPECLISDRFRGFPRLWTLMEIDNLAHPEKVAYHLTGKHMVLGPSIKSSFASARKISVTGNAKNEIQLPSTIKDSPSPWTLWASFQCAPVTEDIQWAYLVGSRNDMGLKLSRWQGRRSPDFAVPELGQGQRSVVRVWEKCLQGAPDSKEVKEAVMRALRRKTDEGR